MKKSAVTLNQLRRATERTVKPRLISGTGDIVKNKPKSLPIPAGSDAAGALRKMRRSEVSRIEKSIPDAKRLQLGKRRISRHVTKRLAEALDRQQATSFGQVGLDPEKMRIR